MRIQTIHSLQNNKYIIDKQLGEGGFGITYKAWNTNMRKFVVIKTPNEKLKTEPDYHNYVTSFIQEGRILSKLSTNPNPHIVWVNDSFIEKGHPYLVMDYIEGKNLYNLVKEKTEINSIKTRSQKKKEKDEQKESSKQEVIAESDALRYIRQIIDALSITHSFGIIHRDISPDNIMLQTKENHDSAVLIDFGIASESGTNILNSKSFFKEYFAPYEQAWSYQGNQKSIPQPTIDIYALSATLYYILTGEFPATAYDCKHRLAKLIPARQLVPSISEGVNQAILKGMAINPQERPQSMKEWLTLLNTPILTTPVIAIQEDEEEKKESWLSKVNQKIDKIPGSVRTKAIISNSFITIVGLLFLIGIMDDAGKKVFQTLFMSLQENQRVIRMSEDWAYGIPNWISGGKVGYPGRNDMIVFLPTQQMAEYIIEKTKPNSYDYVIAGNGAGIEQKDYVLYIDYFRFMDNDEEILKGLPGTNRTFPKVGEPDGEPIGIPTDRYEVLKYNPNNLEEGVEVYRLNDNNISKLAYSRRVIVGIPGDTVEVKNDQVYVNNKLWKGDYVLGEKKDECGPITIPKVKYPEKLPLPIPIKEYLVYNQYFVLSNNPAHPSGSCEWGLIPYYRILGKGLISINQLFE
jgi:serine/threonine-protein kinase